MASIAALAAAVTDEHIDAGQVVVAQGTAGDDVFVIVTGHAEVIADGWPVAALGPGECFGEIAALGGGIRTSTVLATTRAHAPPAPRPHLREHGDGLHAELRGRPGPRRGAARPVAAGGRVVSDLDRLEQRRAALPVPTYPDLPVVAHREAHPRRRSATTRWWSSPGRPARARARSCRSCASSWASGVAGLIGHTQPRRLAARAVSERIAEELGTEIGEAVGYTVRFNDRVGAGHLHQGDDRRHPPRRDPARPPPPRLRGAHHRRGPRAQPQHRLPARLPPPAPPAAPRPQGDHHVGDDRHRPLRRPLRRRAGGRGVGTLVPGGGALPPDRGGRGRRPRPDAGDLRRRAGAHAGGPRRHPRVPLRRARDPRHRRGARPPRPAGHRAPPAVRRASRRPSSTACSRRTAGRRIVLATNVAETSLTVPGIVGVVDPGTARISRYNRRTKVQRLPIEAISQASAAQRAGRCGRVAPGHVHPPVLGGGLRRLGREFTEPEILRTNLASVILQMAALGLGDIAAFPFVEPPDARSIKDGILLLEELGALDRGGDRDHVRLTKLGRRLARIPADPRLARMVARGRPARRGGRGARARRGAVDPGPAGAADRRASRRPRSSTAASPTRTPTSSAYLNLWRYLREQQKALRLQPFRRMCKAEHLHHLRIREWQDVHSQLRQVARGHRARGASAGRRARPRRHPPRAAGRAAVPRRDARPRRQRVPRRPRGALRARAGHRRWASAVRSGSWRPSWWRPTGCAPAPSPRSRPSDIEQAAGHLVTRSYEDPWWDEAQGRRDDHRAGEPLRAAARDGPARAARPGRSGRRPRAVPPPRPRRRRLGRAARLRAGEQGAGRRRGRRSRSGCVATCSWATTTWWRSSTRACRPTSPPPAGSTGGGRAPPGRSPTCSPTRRPISSSPMPASIDLADFPDAWPLGRRPPAAHLRARPDVGPRRGGGRTCRSRCSTPSAALGSTGRCRATGSTSSRRSCAPCRRTPGAITRRPRDVAAEVLESVGPADGPLLDVLAAALSRRGGRAGGRPPPRPGGRAGPPPRHLPRRRRRRPAAGVEQGPPGAAPPPRRARPGGAGRGGPGRRGAAGRPPGCSARSRAR